MQALPKGDNFMLISSKGRYTLYVLVDLAKNGQNRYIPLKEIAERQNISKKYMEGILKTLVDRNLLEGVKGKGGGYKLSRAPEQYTVGSIIRLTEGSLAPVACLEEHAEQCPRVAQCRTLPMWKAFDRVVNEFFDGYTLADLMRPDQAGDDYVI